MFTEICVSFIDVNEFDGNVNLNVFTRGYWNVYCCIILPSKSLVWSAAHLNFWVSVYYILKTKSFLWVLTSITLKLISKVIFKLTWVDDFAVKLRLLLTFIYPLFCFNLLTWYLVLILLSNLHQPYWWALIFFFSYVVWCLRICINLLVNLLWEWDLIPQEMFRVSIKHFSINWRQD